MIREEFLAMYTPVRIKKTALTGTIVLIDTMKNTRPPIYLVEIDEEDIDDCDRLVWCEGQEIVSIKEKKR